MAPGDGTSSWLEWAELASTTITGIAWPVAIALLAWLFRIEIRKKFDDIEEAGPGGVKFRRQAIEGNEPKPEQPLSLPQASLTRFQTTIRDSILEELKRFEDDQEKITVLVNELTVTRELKIFETAYADIFGSQIRALEQLESVGGRSSIARAKDFFEEVRKSEPEFYASASFDDWARYLTVYKLVKIDGNDVVLTDAGRDFLCFTRTYKPGYRKPY